MLAARSEHRNTAASAQSSAVIGRPSGWLAPTDVGDLRPARRPASSRPPAAMKPV